MKGISEGLPGKKEVLEAQFLDLLNSMCELGRKYQLCLKID